MGPAADRSDCSAERGSLPPVSVIIPTRQAQDVIVDCLAALAEQDYAGPVEVVIAEAGDCEAMSTLVADHANTRVVPNPAKLTTIGIQTAIDASHGEYLIRCDAHVRVAPDYISTAIETLRRTGAANVGGRQVAEGSDFLQRGIACALNSFAGTGGAVHRSGRLSEGPSDTAYLGCLRRDTLDRVGGYNFRYIRNEDYELNYRLRMNGLVVWYDPKLVVRYTPRRTIRKLILQYFRYGRSKARLILDHPRSIAPRHLPAPILVLLALAGTVLAAFGQTLPLVLLAVAYGAFVLGATLNCVARRKDPAAFLLMVILPVLHLSWGLGVFFPAKPVTIEPDDSD